ncbi:mRNA interferase (fragment) [Candidatus Sulfopaludibacter sp. SbA4]
MEIQQGDIYLYSPLDASGSEQAGQRPYIIMSRDIVHKNKPTAVGVPLTTKTHKANSYRILLPVAELLRDPASDYEFQTSVALCDHVRVMDLSRLRRESDRYQPMRCLRSS